MTEHKSTMKERWNQGQGCTWLGLKEEWQEYPCITAHCKDYALIAESEKQGKIVDKDGNTIKTGNPEELTKIHNKWDDKDIPLCFIEHTPDGNSAEYEFWKEKYPELLKD
ncbi:hypothetical protein FACS189419_05140 [Planctomycetales bacterium]|nr:hypothetical protein FACS189419_05140 [Planctomycetales bacterium]